MSSTNNPAAAATNASTSASAQNPPARDPISGQPIATLQLQDRAITILENNQLMMRYAVANKLVSAVDPGWVRNSTYVLQVAWKAEVRIDVLATCLPLDSAEVLVSGSSMLEIC